MQEYAEGCAYLPGEPRLRMAHVAQAIPQCPACLAGGLARRRFSLPPRAPRQGTRVVYGLSSWRGPSPAVPQLASLVAAHEPEPCVLVSEDYNKFVHTSLTNGGVQGLLSTTLLPVGR